MQSFDSAVSGQETAEATLVASARMGDEGAIRELVQRHNRRLYRVAWAVLGDDGDAEDAVQEAYLHAFRSLGGFRGDSRFGTWLTRIVLNEALQRLRKRRRMPAGAMPAENSGRREAEVIAFPGVAPADPERAAARRQVREMIEVAVEKLPRPLRVVFILRDVEELSIAETACHLGLPEATVKTRLHRARKQLRNHLHTEMAAMLSGTFPFAGNRCSRMVDRVLERLRG